MKMKVTQEVIVDLNEKQTKAITLKYLKELRDSSGIPKNAYVEKNNLMEWEDTGHGSGTYHTIRQAKPIDKAIILLIERLSSKTDIEDEDDET